MFLSYLNDKKSWLFFYMASIGLIDFVLLLDQGIQIEFTSVLYLNLLLFLAFNLFIIWRYQMEIKFTKELVELLEEDNEAWYVALPTALYKQDAVTRELLQSAAIRFSSRLSEVQSLSIQEGDYIAAWIHEVKTPLTAMKLMIDEHRQDPHFRKIETEWLRLHLLVDQQLSISRLPSLEKDYVLEKTNLQQLVSREVKELASWCMEKNVAVEFDGEGIDIVADVKWCRFIIRQLLTNAIKYSPIGGTITIIMKENEMGHTVLQIQDEGPGIAPHDLPRIFEKGFTGGAGRIHNAASGLGLYLAKMVASKMGITLTATTEVGKGTRIGILFPNENDFDKLLK